MAGLTILAILETIAAQFGAPDGIAAKIMAAIEAAKALYPDVTAFANQIESIISSTLAQYGDPAKLQAIIKAVSLDIATGMTGIDAEAWKSSV